MLGDVVEVALAVGDVRVVTDDPAGRWSPATSAPGWSTIPAAGRAPRSRPASRARRPLPRRQRRSAPRPAVGPERARGAGAARAARARRGARRDDERARLPRAERLRSALRPGQRGAVPRPCGALGIDVEELALRNLVDDVDTLDDLERLGPRAGARTAELARSHRALMKVVCLSGGVGGAKLARGLHDVLAPGRADGDRQRRRRRRGARAARLARPRLGALRARRAERRGARLGPRRRDLAGARGRDGSGAARAGSCSATSTSGSTSCARRRSATGEPLSAVTARLAAAAGLATRLLPGDGRPAPDVTS